MICYATFANSGHEFSRFALLSSSVSTSLPVGLESLGTSLIRVFQFEESSGQWRVFDPRPQIQPANSIREMQPGESYWIRVSEALKTTLNGQPRDLVSGWNTIVW